MRKLISNTEDWKEKAKHIHNNKYDYSLVTYQRSYLKVVIICPRHGIFEQVSSYHLMGNGCPKCGKSFTTENFLLKAKKVHGDRYDYSKSIYTRIKDNIIITCKMHGDFTTKAGIHLRGFNCPKCSLISKDDFIKKANSVHRYKYSYDKVNYTSMHEKIDILCLLHGYFSQRASAHIEGQGCKICSTQINRFKKSVWNEINSGKSVYLYLIECYNEDEKFYKVGITANFKQRFNNKRKMPYNFKVLFLAESKNTDLIWTEEKRILNENQSNRYFPQIKFGGSQYECFDENLLKTIESLKCANME